VPVYLEAAMTHFYSDNHGRLSLQSSKPVDAFYDSDLKWNWSLLFFSAFVHRTPVGDHSKTNNIELVAPTETLRFFTLSEC